MSRLRIRISFITRASWLFVGGLGLVLHGLRAAVYQIHEARLWANQCPAHRNKFSWRWSLGHVFKQLLRGGYCEFHSPVLIQYIRN